MHHPGLAGGERLENLLVEVVEDIQLILDIRQCSPIFTVSSQKENDTILCSDPIGVIKSSGIVFAFGMFT